MLGYHHLPMNSYCNGKYVIEERYCWLKERGIGYVFAIAPSKAQVYSENLSDQILNVKNKLNRSTRYDQLISYLQKNCAVPIVDLRGALRAAKNEPPDLPLYYRTDFHWNYYGAFIAYQAIIESIMNAYPEYNLVGERFMNLISSAETIGSMIDLLG